MRVNADNDATGPGRLLVGADDPSLTPYAGLVIVGELARRRGLSAGALVVSLAECQIAGAECW